MPVYRFQIKMVRDSTVLEQTFAVLDWVKVRRSNGFTAFALEIGMRDLFGKLCSGCHGIMSRIEDPSPKCVRLLPRVVVVFVNVQHFFWPNSHPQILLND